MLQRLPISLAQVKTGNTSENLLNEIRKVIYFLYWEKAVTRTVYNNIMNSVGFNFKNRRTSDPHRLLLNLTDRISLEGSDKYLALSNFSIYYACKNIK